MLGRRKFISRIPEVAHTKLGPFAPRDLFCPKGQHISCEQLENKKKSVSFASRVFSITTLYGSCKELNNVQNIYLWSILDNSNISTLFFGYFDA